MEKKGFVKQHSLYLVLTEEYGQGRSALDIARSAVAGGVDIVQMREKGKTRPELHTLGMALSRLCKQNGVLFIVNDDPCLARELQADGVHMGQEDMDRCPIDSVRRIIGPDKIIGVSTHSPDQFRQANDLDIDYIAFGPIFPTKTKDYHVGMVDVQAILQMAMKPVVFIGGIDTSNVQDLLDQGAGHIALIRDIVQADDIASRVGWYKQKLADCGKPYGEVKA